MSQPFSLLLLYINFRSPPSSMEEFRNMSRLLASMRVSNPRDDRGPGDTNSREDEMDMVKAAKDGPFLLGTDKARTWPTDNELDSYRTELAALLKSLTSTDKARKILKAVCDSREWKSANCKVCRNVNADELFVEHVLSTSHINNLKLDNLSPSTADYHVLRNVLMRATWCTKKADVKNVHVPFLHGFKNPEPYSRTPVTESILSVRQTKFLGILSMLGSSMETKKSRETACRVMFSENNIKFCSSCKVKMSFSSFADHVLSDEHLGKILASGKCFWNTDVGFMSDLLGLCELIHSKFEDAQKLFEDTYNTRVLPFWTGRSTHTVSDRMNKDEVLEVARLASKPEFELQRTGTELAYQGYKVRNKKCRTCAKLLKSNGVAMDHLISKEHLTKVMDNGYVFSRSLDRDILLGASASAIRTLKQLKAAFASY